VSPDTALLDNIFWHSLVGPQAKFAAGEGAARRYARGFSPIVAFADAQHPDFSALMPYCSTDEHFYCDGWSGPVQPGWAIERESSMFKMVWNGTTPARDEADDAIALGAQHAQQAVELAELTRPGPFGLRNIELGDYFGYFEGDRLVAMAGERSQAGTLREISGVCTHPAVQGRGYARRLMTKLVRRQVLRGETPFLHVMCDNASAHMFYARMGFAYYRASVVRVVSRCGSP
jgi:GNAT superfamily N-acetyltransferase